MRSVIGVAAYLRVYEPLAAFAEPDRRRWAEYAASGAAPPRAGDREHLATITATFATPPRVVPAGDVEQAYVRHLDGVVHVCPWQLAPRCWQALELFRSQLPDELADAFVPPAVADAAAREYAEWSDRHPAARLPILTATWQIPIPWFVLFEAEERRLTLGEPGGGGARRTGVDRELVYLTAMSRARRRLARALSVVRRAFEEGPAVDGLEELGRWLEEFHPHSVVELDYGGLVHLVDDDTLREDRSVADIADAIAHLAAGRAREAADLYEVVADRWREIALVEHSN